MFEVYVDAPSVAAAPRRADVALGEQQVENQLIKKTKLTISKTRDKGLRKEVTLAPRLSFASFEGLKEQIEALVRSVARSEEEEGWRLQSLQYCDDEGDMVSLLPSTFDPRDFALLPVGRKVYLRATVIAGSATSPRHPCIAQKSSSLPAAVAAGVEGKKTPIRTPPLRRRHALRQRSENTLSLLPPSAGADDVSSARAWGKHTTLKKPVKTPAAAATTKATTRTLEAVKARRPLVSTVTADRIASQQGDGKSTVVTTAAETTAVASSSTPLQQPLLSSNGTTSDIKNSRRGCTPAYVFKAKRSGGSGSGSSSDNPGGGDGVCLSKFPQLRSGGSRRQRAPAQAAAPEGGGRKKPGWNIGNEPAWEVAERKKADMRKEARARILVKRAAAAAKRQARGGVGVWGVGVARRGKGRVFRRAKRDCRVTDDRRRKLGAYLFCEPIGSPPPALGKRGLGTYRELGRVAAAQMKYLPIADDDPAPKRSCSGDGHGGGGYVVVPRHVTAVPGSCSGAEGRASSANVNHSTHSGLSSKAVADKRVVVAASNTPTMNAVRKGGSAKSPPTLPSALRPPTARPGDIGFYRGGVGFRMRPPPPPPPTAAAAAAAAATATATAKAKASSKAATSAVRGRDGGAGGGQGATAMTAAAAAKVRTRARGNADGGGSSRHRSGPGVAGAAACEESDGSRPSREEAAAAAAIMAKLSAGRGRGRGRRGGGGGGGGGNAGICGGEGEDMESLQEQVALLKAAAGLSDEELQWRMETAKPEANAYRIASVALEKAETTYERLLWRQGQLQIAQARLTGRGVGGDAATSAFAAALSQAAAAATRGTLGQDGGNDRILSRLGSSSEAVLATLPEPPTATTAAASAASASAACLPADVAARVVRATAGSMVKLVAAVLTTTKTRSQVDYAAVREEVKAEAQAIKERADLFGRDLAAVGRRVEAAIGQMESWQQRKADAPEFAAEEAAKEQAWNEANRATNESALREMRALLPEAVWDMNAGDIQAAAAAASAATAAPGVPPVGGGKRGVFYPSDLCSRLRECRPLHWLVSAPEDIAGANFLVGEGAAAFTQLEGMDLTEMRAVWSVLPREFLKDADGKKAEWRKRFRLQLELLVRQQSGAVVTAGWDPVRGRRATARLPQLPAHRARHPAYFYPTLETTKLRVARLREQHERLLARKERLSALEADLADAKSEVDLACADARSGALRERYGAETLRRAREVAKEAYAALVREKESLSASVSESEAMLSSTYPSLDQLEAESKSIARILEPSATATTKEDQVPSTTGDLPSSEPSTSTAESVAVAAAAAAPAPTAAIRVPGAFSEEPELRRRAVAAARKLSPEEERRLRACEVQRAVSSRDAGASDGNATAAAATAADDAAAHAAALGRSGSSVGGETVPPLQKEQSSAAAAAFEKKGESMLESTATVAAGLDGRGGDGAPIPPRRPVKIAPAVLALLTKQHSARAAAARAAGAAGGGGASSRLTPVIVEGFEASSTEAVPRAPIGDSTANCREEAVLQHTSGTLVPPAPPLPTQVRLPMPPPAQVRAAAGSAKPMSKSLASLLALEEKDGPASCSGGKGGGRGRGGVVGKAAIAQPLGFLDELKARAAAKNGDAPTGTAPCLTPALPPPPPPTATTRRTTAAVVAAPEDPETRDAAPSMTRGISFLDELKAKTPRIS